MPQLKRMFPKYISTYIEPFAGGGSSFLNTNASNFLINDNNYHMIALHKCLSQYADERDEFLNILFDLIDCYGLSCSYRNINVPRELKKKYVKTYYSRYNKDAYLRLRKDFNLEQDTKMLYLLLVYGFNHMIRFNKNGEFNLPVGNVDFNKNVYDAICDYLNFMKNNTVEFYNYDFEEFIGRVKFDEGCYVYLDPPYLVSDSEYNKYWNDNEERRLYKCLDNLNKKGINFGVSNLLCHKGKYNSIFSEWAKSYNVYSVRSNYISYFDNTIKADSEEVFVTNYGK